ncbi:MAG TPA: toprim domain-containing protein [Candidatus Thermoplasmatota archaeon]|nr:toprim domain-containing protein [Candidatus Thermoplasmatota archaeon]
MDDEERFDRLLDVLLELREANEETPIVVEGARDVASLRLLGLAGHIIPLHSGEPLFQVAESIAAQADEVILLTDWDAKGQTLFDSLRTALAANGVKSDGKFRDDLRHHIRPTLKDVESLAGYVQRNLERFHRKDLADL